MASVQTVHTFSPKLLYKPNSVFPVRIWRFTALPYPLYPYIYNFIVKKYATMHRGMFYRCKKPVHTFLKSLHRG